MLQLTSTPTLYAICVLCAAQAACSELKPEASGELERRTDPAHKTTRVAMQDWRFITVTPPPRGHL
jgi:hypothetical protein